MNLDRQATEEEWVNISLSSTNTSIKIRGTKESGCRLPEKDIDELFDDFKEIETNGMGEK